MSDISVRIDDLKQGMDQTNVLVFIDRCKPEHYIITREIAKKSKKIHYHLYIHGQLSIKQVRNKFTYLFGEHKGSNYAIAKVRKVETFRSYILKDGDVLQSSYTKKELEEMKTWIPRSEYKKSVLTRLKEHIPNTKSLEEIAHQMCEYYDTHNMAFDKYRMKAYAYAIYYANNNGSRDIKKEISRYIIE
ncbi:MAG: replication protein [Circoviridae sp.]|nr:MAG: replication protein [Circoviridae sp.]